MLRQHPFDLLMELDTSSIRLDCAALHLAADHCPGLSVPTYLQRLDVLANRVADLRPGLSAAHRYRAMRDVLVEESELRGNQDDYYDPENSFLNRVLDRKLGVPISLSAIWIEVGRRLKWPVSGVGFPGHFLVRFDDPERFVVADPFRGGQSLDIDDCKALLKVQSEGVTEFTPDMLAPIDTRAILVRMLQNLRAIYAVNEDWDRLLFVVQRLAAIEPDVLQHAQELAALHYQRRDYKLARGLLLSFMQRELTDEQRTLAVSSLDRLDSAIAALN